ncbi:hypothetical protein BU25DRAFT_460019 [Macroventuria anomochaeta]|uniref:Uncharacterized protein n=1 Tax=Macroventuria anomochaeta TaxID=301207 RepID=A0ACB6RUQ0_9PLEO|nr:uncharacterized protein BU25DRAFT_460019 [Macroventuria anomochaeta]KAF2625646.1 hypothetical protein BU25DRAFT_460019 [Macroventuria anomochaeta]
MTTPSVASSVDQVTRPTIPLKSKTVGNYIGLIGKFGHRCWEAKEPLRDLFHTQIRREILQHLDGLFGSVSTQDSIIVTLYMIGLRSSTAAPTVLFVSENESNRKAARKLIKECGILKQCRGWKTAQAPVDPGWGAQLEQLASGHGINNTGGGSGPATQVLYDPSRPLRSQGMTLYISHPSGLRTMTANLIRLHGKIAYLAPAHAFFDRKDESTLKYDDSVDDFEIDSDDELETNLADDDIIHYPKTELDDLESDKWSCSDYSEDSDTFSAKDSGNEAFSQSSFGSSELTNIADTTNYGIMDGAALQQARTKLQVPIQDLSTPASNSLAPFGVLSRWSTDKDWALVDVSTDSDSYTSAFFDINPEDLSKMPIASYNPAGAAIVTHTASSGELTGVMSSTPADMCVPQGSSFHGVFPVRLDGPLADGDCGSAVVDAITGELYGHIVAGCRTTGFAYVMAAYHVMPDLYKAIQTYELGPSSTGSTADCSVESPGSVSTITTGPSARAIRSRAQQSPWDCNTFKLQTLHNNIVDFSANPGKRSLTDAAQTSPYTACPSHSFTEGGIEQRRGMIVSLLASEYSLPIPTSQRNPFDVGRPVPPKKTFELERKLTTADLDNSSFPDAPDSSITLAQPRVTIPMYAISTIEALVVSPSAARDRTTNGTWFQGENHKVSSRVSYLPTSLRSGSRLVNDSSGSGPRCNKQSNELDLRNTTRKTSATPFLSLEVIPAPIRGSQPIDGIGHQDSFFVQPSHTQTALDLVWQYTAQDDVESMETPGQDGIQLAEDWRESMQHHGWCNNESMDFVDTADTISEMSLNLDDFAGQTDAATPDLKTLASNPIDSVGRNIQPWSPYAPMPMAGSSVSRT